VQLWLVMCEDGQISRRRVLWVRPRASFSREVFAKWMVAMADGDLRVSGLLAIPGQELREMASRAGGPGGQHVNKSNTRVTLRWNVRESRALSDRQRQRLLSVLGVRLTRDGDLVVHADRRRSRARNQDDARERVAQLVRDALAERKDRRPTRPSLASKNRVKATKKFRSEVKRSRRRVPRDTN